MENRAETMAEGRYDFGFAIEWMAKDLGYALEEAQRHGLALPQAGQTLSDYRELMARGHQREDSSALYRTIAARAQKPSVAE